METQNTNTTAPLVPHWVLSIMINEGVGYYVAHAIVSATDTQHAQGLIAESPNFSPPWQPIFSLPLDDILCFVPNMENIAAEYEGTEVKVYFAVVEDSAEFVRYNCLLPGDSIDYVRTNYLDQIRADLGLADQPPERLRVVVAIEVSILIAGLRNAYRKYVSGFTWV